MNRPQPALDAWRIGFILDNTRPRPVPMCPDIRLHVAEEALPLWAKTEEELGAIGLPPPYWAFAWAGGQALARYPLDNPETVRGLSVLDLGAGSGLVSIAAMRAGARRAEAADTDPWAIAAIGLNAALNGVDLDVAAHDLLDGPPGGPTGSHDLVLVGDLFYERGLADRVLAFLDACAAAGAHVLVGDPGRSYLPKRRLERIAEYGVPTTRALEDSEIKRTGVWHLAPARDGSPPASA